jgi:hypothetical protein
MRLYSAIILTASAVLLIACSDNGRAPEGNPFVPFECEQSADCATAPGGVCVAGECQYGPAATYTCPPGNERACWCEQGYESVQICNADGFTVGACDCSAECADDADCHGMLCEPAVCSNGACVRSTLPDGTMVLTSPEGDCAVQVCATLTNGDHYAVFAVDLLDVPYDGNPCTVDICAPWGPDAFPAIQGTPCQGGVCDGAGICGQGAHGAQIP